ANPCAACTAPIQSSDAFPAIAVPAANREAHREDHRQEGRDMANGIFIAWTSPASPDVEDELNKWYDEIHIPQVRAAIPAITGARRFKVHGGDGPSRYLCIYELEGDDLDGAAAALGAAGASGQL